MAESVLVKMVDGGFRQLQANAVEDAVIAKDEQDSEVIDAQGFSTLAVLVPSTFNGDNLTLKASDEKDGTFRTVYTGANEVKVAVDTDRIVNIAVDGFDVISPLAFIKLSSDNVGGESAERTLKVMLGL